MADSLSEREPIEELAESFLRGSAPASGLR